MTKADTKALENIGRQLLLLLGEDPEREGLLETPARWARWCTEFIEYDAGNLGTVFPVIETDQMVVVSPIRVWSLCEHHLLPFYCDLSIGYLAKNHVLGLSKFARIAHHHAHKLQIQERLVEQIAADIRERTGSNDVAVLARGEHLCMSMRGVRSPAVMTSSSNSGVFRDNHRARAEFLSLVGPQGRTV